VPDVMGVTASRRNSARARTISDAEWFWRLSEKKPGSKMPGFKDKLSEAQRWQVITYLRTLAQAGR